MTTAQLSVKKFNQLRANKTPLEFQAALANYCNYKPFANKPSQSNNVTADKIRSAHQADLEAWLQSSAAKALKQTNHVAVVPKGSNSPIAEIEFSKNANFVIGQYGAFLEICDSCMQHDRLMIEPSQAYRMTEPWHDRVKYEWWTPKDVTTKLYYQLRTVSYASYQEHLWYVSPWEITLKAL